jgi:hypothetical protein
MIVVLILGILISLLSVEFFYRGIRTKDYYLLYEGMINFIFGIFCIMVSNYF